MSERTQSPQNVVVPVDDLLFYKLKDLLLEQSEGEWTDAMIVRDAHHFANHLRPLLAAAPAPSSLAGGEDEIALIVAQACLDYASDTPSKFSERTVALGEITKSAVHRILSALSPEAPARETWEGPPEIDREVYDYLREIEILDGYDQIVDWPEIVTALRQRDANLDAEIEALTPRHEAPADLHERNLTASNAELIEQALSHPPLEAPDDTVTISRPEYEKLKSGYPGDPSLLHEALASHSFEASHSVHREGGCKVCGHDEASHEAPAEPWYGDCDPHEVDQAYGEYDGTSCELCKRERVMVGGATGKRICEKCGAYQEAPAEGAGEIVEAVEKALTSPCAQKSEGQTYMGYVVLDVALARKIINALRARSSAPEAREGEAVSCMACMDTEGGCNTCGGYTHPAAPSADCGKAGEAAVLTTPPDGEGRYD